MRCIRNRTGVLAALAIMWHVLAIAVVSAVLSCDQGSAVEHARLREAASAEQAWISGHEGMADCPMQKNEPACPLHAEKHGTTECDCPTVGCSQTDAGFMALFGAVGILSNGSSIDVPLVTADAAVVISAAVIHLAPVPPAPPPRA